MKDSDELDFQGQLDIEVSKRLGEMEEPGYEFPERMKRSDWVIAVILMVVSLVVVEVATLTAGGVM